MKTTTDTQHTPSPDVCCDTFKQLYAAVEAAGLALCEMSFCLARGGEFVDAEFLFKMAGCLNAGAVKGEGVEGLMASCEPVTNTLSAMALLKARAGHARDAMLVLQIVDFLNAAIAKTKEAM